MNWQLFWQIVFIVVLTAFGLMSVLVTINGARDVKKLITGLKDDSEQSDE